MKNITALITIATFTTLSGLAMASSPAAATGPGLSTSPSPGHVNSTSAESATPLKAKAAGTLEKTKAPSSAKHAGAAATSHTTDMKK